MSNLAINYEKLYRTVNDTKYRMEFLQKSKMSEQDYNMLLKQLLSQPGISPEVCNYLVV